MSPWLFSWICVALNQAGPFYSQRDSDNLVYLAGPMLTLTLLSPLRPQSVFSNTKHPMNTSGVSRKQSTTYLRFR